MIALQIAPEDAPLVRAALDNYLRFLVATGDRDRYLATLDPEKRSTSEPTRKIEQRARVFAERAHRVRDLLDQLPKAQAVAP